MSIFAVAVVMVLCLHQAQAYKVAVVEYNPLVEQGDPLATILKNIDAYRTYADQARQQSVEIIVFPEYGLTTVEANPEEYAIDFNSNETKVLEKLGIVAKERDLYVVVNLLEKENQGDKTIYYNTNLVFNKTGDIVARYRKINLNNEIKLTPGNATVIFHTEFGVTFGVMTSSDILYTYPSKTLLDNPAVTDIILPLAWNSKMPFYTSLGLEYGYAVAKGVNLLVASYNDPAKGYGGSGIYSGDGTIEESYIDPQSSSKLIVQDVQKIGKRISRATCIPPKDPHGLPGGSAPDISQFNTTKVFKNSDYTIKNIDLTQNETSTQICSRQFCCTFNVSVSDAVNTSEIYKLVAYDGKVSFNGFQRHLRVCSLLACESHSTDSCGARTNSTTRFKKISVEGNLSSEDGTSYFPATLTSSLKPIKETSYCDTAPGNGTTFVRLNTYQALDGVLVFGIVGQVSGALALIHHSVLLLSAILCVKLLW